MRQPAKPCLVAAVLTIALAAGTSAHAALDTWAVLPAKAVQDSDLADLVTVSLSSDNSMRLVERARLSEATKELVLAAMLESGATGQRLRLGQTLKADALVFLGEGLRQGKPCLRLVISETRCGARLWCEEFPYESTMIESLAASVCTRVQETRRRFACGIRHVFGVPPFICRNLTRDYDGFQTGYSCLLSEALTTLPGVAVIETAEAHQIGREIGVAGAAGVDRVVPLFVEGEYEIIVPLGGKEPTVTLGLKITDGKNVIESPASRTLNLAEAARYLGVEMPPRIARLAKGDALSPERQLAALTARAEALARLGSWDLSTGLREAALLLKESDAAQRTTLCQEYVSALKATIGLPQTARPTPGDKVYDQLVHGRMSGWYAALHHIEYLLRNQQVTLREATDLIEAVLGGLQEIRFWGSLELLPAEQAKKKFLHDVFPAALALPEKGDALPDSWVRVVRNRTRFREDRLSRDKEDLDYFFDMMENVVPDGQLLMVFEETPANIAWFRRQRPPQGFTAQEYLEFVDRLKQARRPVNVFVGKYAELFYRWGERHEAHTPKDDLLPQVKQLIAECKSLAPIEGIPVPVGLRLAYLQDDIRKSMGLPPDPDAYQPPPGTSVHVDPPPPGWDMSGPGALPTSRTLLVTKIPGGSRGPGKEPSLGSIRFSYDPPPPSVVRWGPDGTPRAETELPPSMRQSIRLMAGGRAAPAGGGPEQGPKVAYLTPLSVTFGENPPPAAPSPAGPPQAEATLPRAGQPAPSQWSKIEAGVRLPPTAPPPRLQLKFTAVPLQVKLRSGEVIPYGRAAGGAGNSVRVYGAVSYSHGFTRLLPCGGRFDVLWDPGAVLFHRSKGLAEEILSRNENFFNEVVWDGENVWIGTRDEGIWVVGPNGKFVAKISKEHGLPPATELSMCSLGPGRICAVGSFGRTWCAIIELAADGRHLVKVFHTATTQPTAEYQGKDAAADPAMAFTPSWMHWIPSGQAGPGCVLIGRRHVIGDGLPLRVDLDTLKVSIARPELSMSRDCRSGSLYNLDGNLLLVNGSPIRLLAAESRRFPDGSTVRSLGDRDPHTGLCDEVLPFQGRLYVPGVPWYRIDPKTLAAEAIRYEGLPEMRGIGVSVHYGLVYWTGGETGALYRIEATEIEKPPAGESLPPPAEKAPPKQTPELKAPPPAPPQPQTRGDVAPAKKPDAAATDPAQVADLKSDSWEAHCRRGILLHAKGEEESAIQAFTKAIELQADAPAPYLNRGLSYHYLNRNDLAAQDFSRVLELSPLCADAFSGLGAAYAGQGRYDLAIRNMTRAVELQPDAARYRYRGTAYLTMGEINLAIPDLTRAIELKPDDAIAYANRGIAYKGKRDDDSAIRDFSKAIELRPSDAEAWCNRGAIYEHKGDHDSAIRDFSKVIELKPDYALAYNNRGIAYCRKHAYDLAIQDHTRALKMKPEYAEAYTDRGNANLDSNRFDAAIQDYSAALQLQPNNARAYAGRGSAFSRKGQYDLALRDCTKAIELQPDYPKPYCERGIVYARTRQYDLALQDLTKAISLSPRYAEAYGERGVTYGRMGDYEQAIRELTKAVEMKPDFAEGYQNRGIAYAKTRRYDLALRDVEKAIELRPDFAESYSLRASIRCSLKDFDKAWADVKKFRQLGGKPDPKFIDRLTRESGRPE